MRKNNTAIYVCLLGLILFFLAHCRSDSVGNDQVVTQDIFPLALLGTNDMPGSLNANPEPTLPATPVQESTDVGLPVDFGALKVEAALLVTDTDVDRYGNLTVQFSKNMNQASVLPAVTLKDSGGNTAASDIIWISSRKMEINPRRELNQLENYTLEITDAAKSAGGLTLAAYNKSFVTEPDFPMTHQVNGYTTGARGVVLNKTNHGTVSVSSEIQNHNRISSLKLYRLGETTHVELCPVAPCATGSFNVNLSGSALPPVEGGNSYYYEVSTASGAKYYRPFNFNWGKTASNPAAPIQQAVSLVLDKSVNPGTGGALESLGKMLATYAAGDFTMDYTAPGDTTVTPNMSFNGIINQNTSTSRPRNDPDGKYCRGGGGSTWDFLTDVGPFCDIKVTGESDFLGTLKFEANVDAYLRNMYITSETGNIDAGMSIGADRLDLSLGGKKITGVMEVLMEITKTEHCILWCTDLTGLTEGKYVYRLTFTMDTATHQTATAYTLVSSDTSGVLSININGLDAMDMLSVTNGSPGSNEYYNIEPWNTSLMVGEPAYISRQKSGSSWEFLDNLLQTLITKVVDEQVPTLKPAILNGAIRDILQKITPNALNAVLKQAQSGITASLPDYLPSPLDQVSLNLALNLRNDAEAKVSGSNKGLVASADISITATNNASNPRPPAPQDTNSYIQLKPPGALPYPLQYSAANPGALLALHLDVLNQAVYHLWKNGAFNLHINEAFAEAIKAVSGSSEILELASDLLTAQSITSIMAPGQPILTAYDESGNAITIDPTDKVEIHVNPLLIPVLTTAPLSGQAGQTEIPRAAAKFGDLELLMIGRRLSDNSTYILNRVRITMMSKASFSFGTFSNPLNDPDKNGLTAIQLSISDAPGDLFYIIDVLNGPANNPYALDPRRIREVLNPLVKTFVVPLINNVVKEIPLPKMEACGLRLANATVLPIPSNSPTPFLLLNAPIFNYAFSGNCSL